MMKFQLLPNVGSHAGPGAAGKATIFQAGDVVESNQDLAKEFPNKFVLVRGGSPKRKKTKKTAVQKAAEKGAKDILPPEQTEDAPKDDDKPQDEDPPKEEEKEQEEDTPNPLGRDVTHRFPTAEEQDFLVYSDGGAFSVVEKDEPNEALNDAPLKRKDVEPFIAKYLET